MNRPHRPRWSDSASSLAYALGLGQTAKAPPDAGFAYRDFGRWQEKARAHGAWGERFPVQATIDGRDVTGVLLCPALPPRRRSARLARYARLDP